MLELRPNCECYDADLDAGSSQVAFCSRCADTILEGNCPNCG